MRLGGCGGCRSWGVKRTELNHRGHRATQRDSELQNPTLSQRTRQGWAHRLNFACFENALRRVRRPRECRGPSTSQTSLVGSPAAALRMTRREWKWGRDDDCIGEYGGNDAGGCGPSEPSGVSGSIDGRGYAFAEGAFRVEGSESCVDKGRCGGGVAFVVGDGGGLCAVV